jgi:predicted short-subunit dehydrogenase-like oxidoreductase (DUF2520 family)
MKILSKYTVAIIGTGRVGTSLAMRLLKKNFDVQYLIEKSAKNLRIAKKIFGKKKIYPGLTRKIIEDSDVIIICTKDDDIRKIVKMISSFKTDFSEKIIFHTSGTETSAVFGKTPIPSKNCGSLHPIQTFSSISGDSGKYFKNIYITAEGGTGFLNFARYLCKVLEVKFIKTTPGKKQIYHIISVFVSNYLVSYFKTVSGIGKNAGIPENKFLDIFAPLIETAYKNMKSSGFAKSLTGPIERGDVLTVNKHKNILKNLDGKYEKLYELLGIEALKIALSKKSINWKKFKIIEEKLKK